MSDTSSAQERDDNAVQLLLGRVSACKKQTFHMLMGICSSDCPCDIDVMPKPKRQTKPKHDLAMALTSSRLQPHHAS
jgi:hypothetical protein